MKSWKPNQVNFTQISKKDITQNISMVRYCNISSSLRVSHDVLKITAKKYRFVNSWNDAWLSELHSKMRKHMDVA